VAKTSLSVRDTEAAVRRLQARPAGRIAEPALPGPNVEPLEQVAGRKLGAPSPSSHGSGGRASWW